MIQDQVKQFLKKYNMDYESIDMDEECKTYIAEMEKGICGLPGSLPMLPSYLTYDNDIPVNEPVVVIDAGGSNLRVASVYFNNYKQPVIENYQSYPMPGTGMPINRHTFFDDIAGSIKPLLNNNIKIGFCFSYTFESTPGKDGKVLQLSKELKVKGLEGELIGESLLKSIHNKALGGDHPIVVVNDTTASLLGGRASFPDRLFDGYIGFIFGTGTNICYLENNKKILKDPTISSRDGSMVVNMEAGAYGCMRRGVIDLELDSKTLDPGVHKFEKMVSGAYQGALLLTVLHKAMDEGLFSSAFSKNIGGMKVLTTKEMDDFLYYPFLMNNTLSRICSNLPDERENDCQTLYFLIDSLIERAAKLVAIALTSVICKTGIGKNPCSPVCITAEGTTFYKSKLFRDKLNHYIKIYLNEKKYAYCEFVKVDDVTLIGSAIAGLTN